MTKARKRRKAAAGPPKPRDPFAQHLHRRGQAVEPPGKLYKRRSKHPKPPSKDGGFVVGGFVVVSKRPDHVRA